jgi:8-oxo-dGTP pyrophosphatase MutT (NUDIX family)
MHDEIVDLVDEANRVVGRARRSEVRARNLLHRGVGILCRNSRGEVFVHRRTETKDVFPGMYDMFVGGVVGAGEEYAEAARREVAEELGITGAELRYLFHHLYLGPRNRSWVAVYEVEWDGPVRLQESEVAWGAYLGMEALIAKLPEWTFVPDGLEIFQRYRQGSWSQVGSTPDSGYGAGGGSPPRNR